MVARKRFREASSTSPAAQGVDDLQMPLDALFPGWADRSVSAKAIEKDLQQIAEGDQRPETAGGKQRPMKCQVGCDLLVKRGALVVSIGQDRSTDRRSLDSPPSARRDDAASAPGFDDDPSLEQFPFGVVGQDQGKAKLFGSPLEVELADGESPARCGTDDSQETQGLSGFANANSADAEAFRHFMFGWQAIAGLQFIGNDELFDATGDDFAEILALDLFHGEIIRSAFC